MTPREFLEEVVKPNVSDFHGQFDSLRLAYNAIASVDSLAAHIFTWCKANTHPSVLGVADDTVYRGNLAVMNSDFSLLRDMAKAQKHVHLTRGTPLVTDESQLASRTIGFGEGGFGEGRWGGVEQVVVDISGSDFRYVESVTDAALAFLESQMGSLGI